MAIFHLSAKIISRGKGKSAVAAAAYRSGEKIRNEYENMIHDYTRKGGIVHTEILLPQNAPSEYTDRSTLWNAVEQIEKSKNSQLAREIEIALPIELTREQNISLVRQYVQKNFVDEGMCADICIHDKNDGGAGRTVLCPNTRMDASAKKQSINPHAHIMLTMRPFNNDGTWGAKSEKVYVLDSKGEKIMMKSGNYKSNKLDTTDWNRHYKMEEWRESWANFVNATLLLNEIAERVDHRSYERQGIDKIPAVHMGVAASQMEKRGIVTERGNINREIEISNQRLEQLKERISELQDWLEEESANTAVPTLADYIEDILSQKVQSVYNPNSTATMLTFLAENNIMDMDGLDEKFKSMIREQRTIVHELKPIEQRLTVLEKHIKQADIYFKYKDKKKLAESESVIFLAANKYLKELLKDKTTIPIKKWEKEFSKLITEKEKLNGRYVALKNEVKEVDEIRRNVYDVLRQEQRGQLQNRLDIEIL